MNRSHAIIVKYPHVYNCECVGHEVDGSMRLSVYSTMGRESSPVCLFDSNLSHYESPRDLKLDVLPNVEDDFYEFTNLNQAQISASQFLDVAKSIYKVDFDVSIFSKF